ncbi:MAG: GNAT family N-acetyltransferase [Paracoccaceae bacterium]
MTLPVLQTGRLRLRPLQSGDIPALMEGLNDWEVTRWLTAVPFPYTQADGACFLENCAADPAQAHFAIDAGAGLIGVISVKPDLGYWLNRSWHGKGVMSEAARAVVGWYFGHSAEPLISGHYPGNAASRAVLGKLGFRDTHSEIAVQRATQKSVTIQRMTLDRESWKAHDHG